MGSKQVNVVFGCNSFDGTIPDGALFQDKISRRLEEQGVHTLAIFTHFREVKNYFDKRKVPCHYLPEFKERYRIHDLGKELKDIEERYGITLEKLMVGDYDQDHSPRRGAEETMLRVFRFWEDIIDKKKPDYIVGGSTRFLDTIAWAVCQKKKTKYIVMQIPNIPESFCISEDIYGHTTTLDKYWKENSEKELTPEEEGVAKAYVKAIIDSKERPFQLDTKPKMNLAKARFFAEKAYASFFIDRLQTPYSKPWRGAYKYALRMARARLGVGIYSKPDYSEKYVFYPMHVEWDAPIIVWNQTFLDQTFLLQIIARNLPYGVKLYVKPHINDLGGTALSHLRKIKGIRHVKLIDPREDSYRLIKNSAAVAVIGGSVGWEGLLLRKPVIKFGRCFYDELGLTWDVKNLAETHKVIREALTKDRFDEKRLLKFIASYHKICYPGKIYFTQLYVANKSNRDYVLSDENVSRVAEGLRRHMTGETAY